MSIIVHGPQGCGKTLHAELLRQHFRLERVIEEDSPDAPSDLYRAWNGARTAERLKAMNALFITCIEPPRHLAGNRRIIAFRDAIAQAQKGA